MTEVLDGRVDAGWVGRARRDADEPRLVEVELADRLITQAQEQGVQLLGEGGLLKQITKTILERSIAIELTGHLGYEEGDPAGAGSGNSRNGTTPKRLMTETGHVDLEVPRDRNGTFGPQTVRKGQRRLDGVDKLVMGLYARGMTVRDVQTQLKETFDLDLSPDLISKITDGVFGGGQGLAVPPVGPGLPGDFPRRVDLQGQAGRERAQQGRASGCRGRRRWQKGSPGHLGGDQRRGEVLAAGDERAEGPWRAGRADRGLRRAFRVAGGGDRVLAGHDRADLHRAPD